MSGQVNLDSAPLGLKALRDQSRLELQELFDAIPGRKLLVLDQSLTGPLGLVIEIALLRARAVERIFHLLPEPLEMEAERVVYMVRPQLALMHRIAAQVRQRTREGRATRYTVVFVPQRSMICEKVLEEAGVYGQVEVSEYGMDMIPLDTDLLSLETDCFADLHAHGDHVCLLQLARCLLRLQAAAGRFPLIRGKGEGAHAVVELMRSMQRTLDAAAPAATTDRLALPAGPNVIVLDRRCDLVTPMLTQLTYEGLLDECFGIKHSFVELPVAEPSAAQTPPSSAAAGQAAAAAAVTVTVSLNSNDALYAELRDLNFESLHARLRAKGEAIRTGMDQRHAAQTVSQLHSFMKVLGSLQKQKEALATHVDAARALSDRTRAGSFLQQLECEQALIATGGETALLGSGPAYDACSEFAEDLIARAEPLARVLRLLCLMSLVGNGLRQRSLALFRAELLQTYGYQLAFTLDRLEALGLLKRNEARSGWPSLRSALKLIVDDDDGGGADGKGSGGGEPHDVAHIYSGCEGRARARARSPRALACVPPVRVRESRAGEAEEGQSCELAGEHARKLMRARPPHPLSPSAPALRAAATRRSQCGSCSRRALRSGSASTTPSGCCPDRFSKSGSRRRRWRRQRASARRVRSASSRSRSSSSSAASRRPRSLRSAGWAGAPARRGASSCSRRTCARVRHS